MMSPSLRRRSAAMALLAGTLACSEDPAGPAATLPVAAADLDALADALAPMGTHPVLAAYTLPGFVRGLPFDGDFSPFVPLRANLGTGPTRTMPVQQRAPDPFVIPDSLKGRTFVPDSIGFGYVLDTLADGRPRPGAPADAIRFMVAPVISFGSDLTIVGHIDLRQQGSGPTVSFSADAFDNVGTHLMHHAGSPITVSSSGWTEVDGRRIEQTVLTARMSRQTRWTWSISSRPLDVTREESVLSDDMLIRYSLSIGEARLRLVSTRSFATGQITYRVLVGDAPFAERQDVTFMPGTWRHIRDDRPLTASEEAQVRAFVRVLLMLPDSETMFGHALSDLYFLLNPIDF